MRKIYVISDPHLCHGNILRFKDDEDEYIRDFQNLTEMHETIIERWNSVVGQDDIVYVLGDVYFKDSTEAKSILRRLKGRKRLILGNHDNGKDQMLQGAFQKITESRMFREYGVIMTHRPVIIPGGKWTWNLHGHIHQKPSPSPRHVNVSVEAINYTPKDLEEIYEEMK